MEKLVPLKNFPQVEHRRRLKSDWSRYVYGCLVDNAFLHKLFNWRYILAKKIIKMPELTETSKRIVTDLKNNGIAFADFSEFFDDNLFENLLDRFSHYLDEFNDKPYDYKDHKGKATYLKTIHREHRFIQNDCVSEYCSHSLFSAIASEYMGLVARYVGTSFWHTVPATEDDRLYSQRWHRDVNDRTLVKVFLYLTDVGPENGCFEYITGTHRKGSLNKGFDRLAADGRRAYPDQNRVRKMIDQLPVIALDSVAKDQLIGSRAPWHNRPSVIRCVAPKATLIFADTFGLHCGGYVDSGVRNMLMTTYSTNFNLHDLHYDVTENFSKKMDAFMQMSFGVLD